MQLSERDVKAIARNRAVSGTHFKRWYWFWIAAILTVSVVGAVLVGMVDSRWFTIVYAIFFAFTVGIPVLLLFRRMNREEKKLLEEWRQENGQR